MRKYGVEHFHISLLEITDSPEEREIYWIEKLQSFKCGYNATIGGDGRKYIDWDLVIALYQELKNQKEVAKKLRISTDAVHDILIERKIPIERHVGSIIQSKMVKMLDKTDSSVIRVFPSMADAAQYLIDNKFTNCKKTTIRYHISEVCQNKRKTAGGFKWELV